MESKKVVNGCSSKESSEIVVIIGTFLPDSLLSLVATLEFDSVNPVPDMTKRKKALKLITKGSWPPARKSIVNVLSTRSTTSLKELNLGIVAGLAPATTQRLTQSCERLLFFYIFIMISFMSMKKVYLAASFSYQDRNKGNERKKEIENIVHHIKSMTGDRYDFFIPHLLKIPNEWDMSLEEWSRQVYKHDVKALEEAEIVIFLSYGKENNAGSAWEIGYSFAKNKIIVMIKMTDEIESLMLFGSVERIIKKDEIDTYDWINLPKYKTTLHKLS